MEIPITHAEDKSDNKDLLLYQGVNPNHAASIVYNFDICKNLPITFYLGGLQLWIF